MVTVNICLRKIIFSFFFSDLDQNKTKIKKMRHDFFWNFQCHIFVILVLFLSKSEKKMKIIFFLNKCLHDTLVSNNNVCVDAPLGCIYTDIVVWHYCSVKHLFKNNIFFIFFSDLDKNKTKIKKMRHPKFSKFRMSHLFYFCLIFV